MRRHANFWLLALVLIMVLALASSCAAGGSGTAEQGSGEQSGNEESDDDMQGMDHGNMDMTSGGMDASELVMENGKYSDERFIDAMIPHHESAIEMAQVAQDNTSNPEIRELAQGIVAAQQAEIQEMTDWRQEWYPEG